MDAGSSSIRHSAGNKHLYNSWDSGLNVMVSPRGSPDSVVVSNPLFGRKIDIKSVSNNSFFDRHVKPLRHSMSPRQVSGAIENAKELNERAVQFVVNALQACNSLVPTRTNCNFTLLKYLSHHILENSPETIDLSYCQQVRQVLYAEKVFARLITDRVVHVSEALKKFIRENETTTEWIREVCAHLMTLSKWTPLEQKERKSSQSGVNELSQLSAFHWNHIEIDGTIKDFLTKAIFVSQENYAQFTDLIERIGKSAKTLMPIITYLNSLLSSIKTDTARSGERIYSCTLPPDILSKCSLESILRSYIPEGFPLHKRISVVSGNTLSEKLYNGTKAENQREFFIDLLTLLNDKSTSSHEETVEKFLADKELYPFKLLLAAGTIECWSMADKMIRFIFPGLFSAPFVMKAKQGTELDFEVESVKKFKVTQHKVYQVSVRKNPADPRCMTPHANPTGEILISMTIFYNEGRDIAASIKFGNIIFSSEASPYEAGEINRTLSTPVLPPEDWKSATFPLIERKFDHI